MARPPTPLPEGASLPTKKWFFDGFGQGENTFALSTELRPTEVAAFENMELYGKRSARPRRGGVQLGNAMTGSSVDGLFQFKEGSTNDILAISSGNLRKYNVSTGDWDAVSGATFTTGLRTRGVKMRGNTYFGNGVDDFTRYNGSTLQRFTAVVAPTGLTVTQGGATGTTTYAYQVNTVTAKGDSIPCAVVTITNGNATLSPSNAISVTWTRRTETEVIGYNIFGRTTSGTGITLMKYVPQMTSGATMTFVDDGALTPTIWLPPTGDSTDGPVLSIWEQLRGSLVGGGDPNAPHRFYYSGTGEKYESFSPAHNGGWADVRPGDNDAGINGLAPFESRIIIGKERSIHQFKFSETTGDAVLQELITYTGVGAPGSMVVMENDVGFIDAERRFRILGYEPNYGSAIRTTTLSEGRIQSRFEDISNTHIKNCEAVYFNGRYILAYTPNGQTTNAKVLIYDRRYLSFLGAWDGADCKVKSWLVYDGIDKKQRLYAGGSTVGKVWEFGVEGKVTNYDGSMVNSLMRSRNEDLGNSGQTKLFKWSDIRVFRISGTLNVKTILNGATVIDTKPFSTSNSTGWGIKRWGTTRWGVVTGKSALASDLDKTYRKEIYEMGQSLQHEITRATALSDYVIVSMRGEALLLPEEVFDSANII